MPILKTSRLGSLYKYVLLSPQQSPIAEVVSIEPLVRTEDYVDAHENMYAYTKDDTDRDLKTLDVTTRWLFLIPVTILLFLPLGGLNVLYLSCFFVLFLVSVITVSAMKRQYEEFKREESFERITYRKRAWEKTHEEDLSTFHEALECLRRETDYEDAVLLAPAPSASYSPSTQGVRHDIDKYQVSKNKNRKILLLERLELTLKLLTLQKQARVLVTLSRKTKGSEASTPINAELGRMIEEINGLNKSIHVITETLTPPQEKQKDTTTAQNPLVVEIPH